MLNFLKKYRFEILGTIIIFSAVAIIELYSGRSPLGPDGKFGFWDGDIWSSENSQRVADAYSFSHIIHGILFYAFLWLVARKIPMKYRFVIALLIEAGWELLENSPLIINRYREATIAQGYVGDSVLNSVCDVGMVVIGFMIARFAKVWISIALIILMEVGCLFWVRDNLTLNVLMLVRPVESIKVWQSEGQHTNVGENILISTSTPIVVENKKIETETGIMRAEPKPINPAYRIVCEGVGGTWAKRNNWCTGIEERTCTSIGGEFQECAANCFDTSSGQACTNGCVRTCQMK